MSWASPRQTGCTGLLEPQIQRVVQIDVAEHRTEGTALRRSLRGARPVTIGLDDRGLQPFLNESQNPGVPDSLSEHRHQPPMLELFITHIFERTWEH